MHDVDLILTLTGALLAAMVCGYITFRLGLSPIVGYLAAGFVVGPNTPGFVANQAVADQFAEVGVILLMFGVGLQFHVKELLAVKRVAIPGALGQSTVATVLGTLIGVFHGWNWSSSLVFGLALSVASTVVLLRVLSENGDVHTRAGHIAVGWLVVEDLFTVLVMVLLPAIFSTHAGGPKGLPLAIGVAAIKLTLMIGLTFLFGNRLIPWILGQVAATRSRELFTLTVLALVLGIAVISAELFGVSMALGAFLAGMVVGRSEFSLRAATEALPMRDAFAVLFFVSIGMLFNPRHLLESPGLVALALAVILVGKPVAALIIVRSLGYSRSVAIAVGIALAQIGEFSFILAQAGKKLGLLDEAATNTLIAAAIASISLNPMLYRLGRPLERLLRKLRPIPSTHDSVLLPKFTNDSSGDDGNDRDRVVVVGYGPVGRTLSRLLAQNQIEPVVVEMNLDTVRALKKLGMPTVYGDATLRDTLKEAGAKNAIGLVLSSTHMEGAGETIRTAREINPNILIIARSNSLREVPELRKAGAHVVFSGEGEIALAMTEFLLGRLGVATDQIDREREQVRSDLLADSADDFIPLQMRISPGDGVERRPQA
jgi:CPA2 family monovalent cation:H+ antiporter-2